jgi:hypothetical protein
MALAQTAQAYWWADGIAFLLHSIVNSIIFSAPLYLLAQLRQGNGIYLFTTFTLFISGNFFVFALLVYLSLYCNVGLVCIISAWTKKFASSSEFFSSL